MNSIAKWTLSAFAAVAALMGITWFVTSYDLQSRKHFDPQYEQVRRDTFTHSQSYNEGMMQNLDKMRIEYATTRDADAREAIASTVRHDYAAFDRSQLSPEDRAFMAQVEQAPQAPPTGAESAKPSAKGTL